MTPVLTLLALAIADTEIAVDAGKMTNELVALLRFERPDLVFTTGTSTASTRVSLSRDGDLLALAVFEDGAPRIERTIAIERERLGPALRIAVLLIAEMIPEPAPIEPAPIEPAPIEPAPVERSPIEPVVPRSQLDTPAPASESKQGPLFALTVLLTGDLWIAPTAPRLGPALVLHWFAGEELAAGLRIAGSGLICCGAIESAKLSGTVRELGVLADGAYTIRELGRNRLVLTAALGVSFATFRGVATYAGGQSPEHTQPWAIEGLAHAGVALKTRPLLGGASLMFAAGLRLRIARMIVQLPPQLREAGSSLDPGIATPFLELGATFDLF